MLEYWVIGTLGHYGIPLGNIMIHEINQFRIEKNINRGFKKLRVWPPARRDHALEGKTRLPFWCRHEMAPPTFIWLSPAVASTLTENAGLRPTPNHVFKHRGSPLLPHYSNIPSFHIVA